MSPSVYSSTRLLLSSANQDLRMFTKPEVRKVKRVLFGTPDPKATQKFINDELKKIMITKSEKWNFNFASECTLASEGLFDWRPATPRKLPSSPAKRKLDLDVDISEQYCEMSEADVVRPRPIKCLTTSASHVSGEHKVQQSRITDYMRATKRPLSTCDVSKKQTSSSTSTSSDWNKEIPTKIPRLDIVS